VRRSSREPAALPSEAGAACVRAALRHPGRLRRRLAGARVRCRGVRRRARVGSDLWMWGLLAGYLAALTVTYLISPYDIAWHLNSSIGRTMVAPLMILISIMTVWSVLALLPHGAVFATTPGPEPIDEDDGDDHPREASPHAETGAHPAASVEEIATEVGTRSNT